MNRREPGLPRSVEKPDRFRKAHAPRLRIVSAGRLHHQTNRGPIERARLQIRLEPLNHLDKAAIAQIRGVTVVFRGSDSEGHASRTLREKLSVAKKLAVRDL